MKQKFVFLFVFILALFYNCGGESTVTPLEYFPDMFDSPAREAQEGDLFFANKSALRLPPEGAVPQGYYPYEYISVATPEELPNSEKGLKNPITEPLISDYKDGEKKFQIYCSPCHGVRGMGNGSVVGPAPRMDFPVPSLITDKVKGWTDGQIYHLITMGRGLMKSYSYQIEPQDRWKLILYLRKLQEYDSKNQDEFRNKP